MEGQDWLKKGAVLPIDDGDSDEMTVDSKTQQTPELKSL